MKYIATLLLLASAAVYADSVRIDVEWYEDFPPDMVLQLGAFKCTGGGVPLDLFTCSEGSGINIRGLEGYTCLLDPNGAIVATTWFSLNANWDAAYTGPVHGEWKVIPGSECGLAIALADHDSYLAGTYSGKRSVMPSDEGVPLPLTWFGTWKLNGFGVGDYEGIQFKSVNEYVTYSPILFQYEFIDPEIWPGIQSEPEGAILGTMIISGE